MIKPNHPEIGRELLAHEIHEGQIVAMQKEGRNAIATLWVTHISENSIHFHAGKLGITFLACRLPDGHITDDDNVPMAMYAYLGQP